MTASMSCLITMARMYSDPEVSQLIDVINGLKISKKKYLIIFVERLNTSLLREKSINFNTIIHHIESGESINGNAYLNVFLD